MVEITNKRFLALVGFVLALGLGACGGGDNDNAPGGFESQWPGTDGSGRGGDLATGGEGPQATDGSVDLDEAGGEDGANRAIQEADIIQVSGDTLFALSRMNGLSIVDISDPSELRLLGAFRDTRDADPFEMYLDGDLALIMFSGWGQYVEVEASGDDETGYAWVTTSEVVALDVSDPGAIEQLGAFEVPGNISDSRIVGEVLYIVGHEDGGCWHCSEDGARTVVSSLDVSDPGSIAKVAELAFQDEQNEWGWDRRSVTVTSERMYVAGPEYGNDGPVGSTIQVIDITDPAGELVLGASVQAAGEISSRWQMDEHEGVLRVISQPPSWRLTDPPVIQTFTVVSSDEVTALGSTDMRLPRPEQLQAVRFDGERAYAITFERTDPLFTIDLSEPATPRQVGELEIPGWVYHMEPRGDLVIGLGFDQGNSEGAITVSVFDVSDFDQPTMTSRVNFGGQWGRLPEDQDRIHKVFRVLDEAGLILVPYSGERGFEGDDIDNGDGVPEEECFRGGSHSGVQLVDWAGDDLTLRDELPTRGQARRALLRDNHVFAVSDQQVSAFDISDRADASEVGGLALARNVNRALPLEGDVIARLSNDWWSDTETLDFVNAADAENPSAGQGELQLSELVGLGEGCNGYVWIQDAHSAGSRVTLLYRSENWRAEDYEVSLGVVVIDASNPAAPEVLLNEQFADDGEWWDTGGQWAHGIPVTDRGVVHFDGGIAMLEGRWVDNGRDGYQAYRIRVLDLSDTDDVGEATVDLPGRSGYFGLQVDGSTLYTSHHEPVSGRAGVTRFFLDRIDLADPSQPALRDAINVPGVVVHYDASEGHAISVDLSRSDVDGLTWQECAERFAIHEFEWSDEGDGDRGRCLGYQQIVRLSDIGDGGATLRDSHMLDQDRALRRLSAGDGFLAGTVGSGDGGYGHGIAVDVAIDCFGPCGGYSFTPEEPEQLLVFSGFGEGELRTGTIDIEVDASPWYGWWGASNLIAAGDRALVTSRSEMAVIDLADPGSPTLERVEAISGNAQDVRAADNRVVLALGEQGCRVIDL